MHELGEQPETLEISENERAEQEIGPQINFRPTSEDKQRLWRLKEKTGLGITEVIRLSLAQTERQLPFVLPATHLDPDQMRGIIGLAGILRAFCQAALEAMKKEQVSSADQRTWSARFLAALYNPLQLCDLLAEYLDSDEVYLQHDWQHYVHYEEARSLLTQFVDDMRDRSLLPTEVRSPEDEPDAWNWPLVRLYYDDILRIYQEVIFTEPEDEQPSLMENLRSSLRVFLPGEKLRQKRRREARDGGQ